MIASVLTGQKFGGELATVLGLPKRTVWFELRCAVDEVVTVKCEYFPEAHEGKPLAAVFAEFEVVRRDPVPEKRFDFDAWMKTRNEAAHAAMIASHRELSIMDARLGL